MDTSAVKQMLEDLGFREPSLRGDEISAVCAFCGKKKFYYNPWKRVAVCFRGCFAGSIENLVMEIEGCDFETAEARVAQGTDWHARLNRLLSQDPPPRARRNDFEFPSWRPLNRAEDDYLMPSFLM